jgi:hypothetical protein
VNGADLSSATRPGPLDTEMKLRLESFVELLGDRLRSAVSVLLASCDTAMAVALTK